MDVIGAPYHLPEPAEKLGFLDGLKGHTREKNFMDEKFYVIYLKKHYER